MHQPQRGPGGPPDPEATSTLDAEANAVPAGPLATDPSSSHAPSEVACQQEVAADGCASKAAVDVQGCLPPLPTSEREMCANDCASDVSNHVQGCVPPESASADGLRRERDAPGSIRDVQRCATPETVSGGDACTEDCASKTTNAVLGCASTDPGTDNGPGCAPPQSVPAALRTGDPASESANVVLETASADARTEDNASEIDKLALGSTSSGLISADVCTESCTPKADTVVLGCAPPETASNDRLTENSASEATCRVLGCAPPGTVSAVDKRIEDGASETANLVLGCAPPEAAAAGDLCTENCASETAKVVLGCASPETAPGAVPTEDRASEVPRAVLGCASEIDKVKVGCALPEPLETAPAGDASEAARVELGCVPPATASAGALCSEDGTLQMAENVQGGAPPELLSPGDARSEDCASKTARGHRTQESEAAAAAAKVENVASVRREPGGENDMVGESKGADDIAKEIRQESHSGFIGRASDDIANTKSRSRLPLAKRLWKSISAKHRLPNKLQKLSVQLEEDGSDVLRAEPAPEPECAEAMDATTSSSTRGNTRRSKGKVSGRTRGKVGSHSKAKVCSPAEAQLDESDDEEAHDVLLDDPYSVLCDPYISELLQPSANDFTAEAADASCVGDVKPPPDPSGMSAPRVESLEDEAEAEATKAPSTEEKLRDTPSTESQTTEAPKAPSTDRQATKATKAPKAPNFAKAALKGSAAPPVKEKAVKNQRQPPLKRRRVASAESGVDKELTSLGDVAAAGSRRRESSRPQGRLEERREAELPEARNKDSPRDLADLRREAAEDIAKERLCDALDDIQAETDGPVAALRVSLLDFEERALRALARLRDLRNQTVSFETEAASPSPRHRESPPREETSIVVYKGDAFTGEHDTGYGPGEEPPPSDNLYVKGLPPNMTDERLIKVFGAYGSVVQTRVLDTAGFGGDSVALVRMSSIKEAQWVVDNLNDNIPKGLDQAVRLRFADPPGFRAGKGSGKKGKAGSKGDAVSERPFQQQRSKDSPSNARQHRLSPRRSRSPVRRLALKRRFLPVKRRSPGGARLRDAPQRDARPPLPLETEGGATANVRPLVRRPRRVGNVEHAMAQSSRRSEGLPPPPPPRRSLRDHSEATPRSRGSAMLRTRHSGDAQLSNANEARSPDLAPPPPLPRRDAVPPMPRSRSPVLAGRAGGDRRGSRQERSRSPPRWNGAQEESPRESRPTATRSRIDNATDPRGTLRRDRATREPLPQRNAGEASYGHSRHERTADLAPPPPPSLRHSSREEAFASSSPPPMRRVDHRRNSDVPEEEHIRRRRMPRCADVSDEEYGVQRRAPRSVDVPEEEEYERRRRGPRSLDVPAEEHERRRRMPRSMDIDEEEHIGRRRSATSMELPDEEHVGRRRAPRSADASEEEHSGRRRVASSADMPEEDHGRRRMRVPRSSDAPFVDKAAVESAAAAATKSGHLEADMRDRVEALASRLQQRRRPVAPDPGDLASSSRAPRAASSYSGSSCSPERPRTETSRARTTGSGVHRGQVKSYNAKNGFGFIDLPGYGRDIFVYCDHLFDCSSLSQGEEVEFQIVMDQNRPQARQVRVVSQPHHQARGEQVGRTQRSSAAAGNTRMRDAQPTQSHRGGAENSRSSRQQTGQRRLESGRQETRPRSLSR